MKFTYRLHLFYLLLCSIFFDLVKIGLVTYLLNLDNLPPTAHGPLAMLWFILVMELAKVLPEKWDLIVIDKTQKLN